MTTRTAWRRHAFPALLSAAVAPACADAPPVDEVVTMAGDAQVIRRPGGALTAPSLASPEQVVLDFLRARGVDDGPLRVTGSRTTAAGVTHVALDQVIDGLRVHGAYVKGAVDADGRLLQLVDGTITPVASVPRATIDARTALSVTLAELGYDVPTPAQAGVDGARLRFEAGTTFHREPTVEPVAYVDSAGQVRQGFEVETWSVRGNQLDVTLVGADGAVVSTERRTQQDSYRVFVESPLVGPQTIQAGPAPGGVLSPLGWLGTGAQTTLAITGNNGKAYLDVDANNKADGGGTTVTNGAFLATADLSLSPSTTTNRAVSVQDLFYLANVAHDLLYRHGFDEAAGNFQADNLGRGGLGGDPVNLEAQDGSGTDNANFATPNDGSPPRMQMYLWTSALPPGEVVVGSVARGAFGSAFGPALTTTGVTAGLQQVGDGVGDPLDACTALPSRSLTGKVAVVHRGSCTFVTKVLAAQNAGARAVVIVNDVSGRAFSPGGTDRRIKIPSAMVTDVDGAALEAQLGQTSTVRKKAVQPPRIDGSIDADIAFHEYGHGLTWRMVGSMSGALAGAIGEGASDTLAFLFDGDDVMGEYAYSDPAGIRRWPYEGYPDTLADVTGAEVHADGEIYAAAMWRVRGAYLAAGLTVDDLLDDYVDGLNYTPSSPSFEEMRDGMLAAIAASGGSVARRCAVWTGFAALGIGAGATSTATGSSSVSVTESFAVPAGACG